MGNFRFFSDAELVGLKPPLPAMLDMTRGKIDPRIKDPRIILTFTTGGNHCQHSSHYIGAGVDCGTGHLEMGYERDSYVWALVKAAFESGFQRIEICPAHVHLDIGDQILPDGTYPAPILIIGTEA